MSQSAIRNPQSKISLGFTLVEVVLAMGVMAIGLIGVMGIFPTALNTARDSKQETRVAMLAQNIFSDLRARDAVEVVGATKTKFLNQTTSPVNLTNYYTVDGTLTSGTDAVFQADIAVEPGPTLLPDGFQVTVTFQSKIKRQSPVVFTSLLRKPSN